MTADLYARERRVVTQSVVALATSLVVWAAFCFWFSYDLARRQSPPILVQVPACAR